MESTERSDETQSGTSGVPRPVPLLSFLARQMTGSGHEDLFLPHRLNVRCPFSHRTFAGTHSNGRDAPVPVVRIYEENFLGFSYVFCPGRSQQEAHWIR
jgi:hypothetical protein